VAVAPRTSNNGSMLVSDMVLAPCNFNMGRSTHIFIFGNSCRPPIDDTQGIHWIRPHSPQVRIVAGRWNRRESHPEETSACHFQRILGQSMQFHQRNDCVPAGKGRNRTCSQSVCIMRITANATTGQSNASRPDFWVAASSFRYINNHGNAITYNTTSYQ
jgi:hypothetical protein